jgi:large subunit ribosomal protein L21
MYAIVKTGGKQYKVAEGDVITVEKLAVEPGATVNLTPLLVVDGESRTLDAEGLAASSVTAEVVAQTKGPKIKIHKFKNKTGYHKRMGHRQKLTEVKITSVSTAATTASAEAADPTDSETTDSTPAATSEEN